MSNGVEDKTAVKMTVWDDDKLIKDTLIGQIVVPIASLKDGKVHEQVSLLLLIFIGLFIFSLLFLFSFFFFFSIVFYYLVTFIIIIIFSGTPFSQQTTSHT